MRWFKTLKAGRHYLKSFPQIPQLNLILPELRIIKSAKFATFAMPLFALFTILWQRKLAPFDQETFAMAVITSLCALSIIPQCYFWLGKRAMTTIPPVTRHWYEIIHRKITTEYLVNFEHPKAESKDLTYQDLTDLLSKAYEVLPKDFWQEI